MGTKQFFLSVLTTLILVLASGCSTVGDSSITTGSSTSTSKQEQECLAPSPNGDMVDLECHNNREGEDDMERLD